MFKFFESLVDPYVPYAETDQPPRTLLAFMISYSRPFRKIFILAAILSTTLAFVEIGLIFYVGRVVDLLSRTDSASLFALYGLELIAIAVFILLVRPAVNVLTVAVLNNGILPNYGTLYRWRAHRQVLRQSVGWFESDFAGRIANRIMQTPPAAGEAIYHIFDAITFAIAYSVGAVLLLSEADRVLAVPLLLWLALFAWLLHWTITRVTVASKNASDARSRTTGRVVDSYTNIQTVKLFSHHDHEIEYAKEAIEMTRQTFAAEMRIYTKMEAILSVLNGGLIVGVVGWSVWLWSQDSASLGLVAAAAALTLRLNDMTGWLMWAFSSFFQSMGIIAEGMETISHPVALVDRPGARDIELRGGRLQFENIAHHYGKESGGLSGIDLTIEPGERVGLVGRSGAGKSTLVKLLLRFYDVEYGRVLIDGQDIAEIRQESLRSKIGMVAQDSSLLHRSIRDNILYGRAGATEEEMVEAAKRADAHDFILEARDGEGREGYHAHVGERGVKLSGGQRQRIALARVILENAPILVLDEATAALDSESESVIQKALYGVMQGKTVIAIAHRLSTIARMNRIIVMDEGRIVEEGTHQGLLAARGLYARFWARQSGGFIGTAGQEAA